MVYIHEEIDYQPKKVNDELQKPFVIHSPLNGYLVHCGYCDPVCLTTETIKDSQSTETVYSITSILKCHITTYNLLNSIHAWQLELEFYLHRLQYRFLLQVNLIFMNRERFDGGRVDALQFSYTCSPTSTIHGCMLVKT